MEGARQIHELTMKLDTEEEWQKMASTAVGFIGGMLFCKWLAPPKLDRNFGYSRPVDIQRMALGSLQIPRPDRQKAGGRRMNNPLRLPATLLILWL